MTSSRASKASETLSSLNNENRRYILFICIYISYYIDTEKYHECISVSAAGTSAIPETDE